MRFLLTKIRLSWYFVAFFLLYLALVTFLPNYKFESTALTLFSVNSFLYGFYISPVLNSQKARIEELHKLVRSEANAVFSMVLFTKKLPKHLRNDIQDRFTKYIDACTNRKYKTAQKNYEDLIGYCADYKGKYDAEMNTMLEKLVANQQNRTMINMQLQNKVYSNEWMIMAVLFTITLSFILLLDIGSSWMLTAVSALLCTGLSMLMLILLKLSTLTHKKARQMWVPFHTLAATHYYRIADDEDELDD